MKSLFTLILTSSFLLTACGQDSKSHSSASPAPAAPAKIADKDKLTNPSVTDKEKEHLGAPILEKVTDANSGGNPSDFERIPKEFTDKEKADNAKKEAKTETAPKKTEEQKPATTTQTAVPTMTPAVPAEKASAPKAKTVASAKVETKEAKKVEAKKIEAKKVETKAEPKLKVTSEVPAKQTVAKKSQTAKKSAPVKSAYHGEGEGQDAPPKTPPQAPPQAQRPQPPVQYTPCTGPCANIKTSQPEFPGLDVTGLTMTPDQSYITLVNDGLMTAIKREMTRGNMDQVRSNSMLAQSLVNGRMFIDPATADRLVTLKVSENGQVQTYNFRVTGYTNRLKPMRLVPLGPYARTTGYRNLQASLACMDTCGKCEVAVLKVESASGGPLAKAYAILRAPTADLKFRMAHPDSRNPDVASIRNFFVNSDLGRSTSDRVENAKVETFEVAYGVSMVRTIIMGLNGEMFSQVSPLVHSTQGALNLKMRMADRNPQDLDAADLENHSTYLSAKVALARLVQVDGNGSLMVDYTTPRLSSNQAGEGFYVKFKARPTPVFPMTGALLR